MIDKMISREILDEKEYEIKPFKRLTVGDPCYFEENAGLHLTIDETLPSFKSRKTGVVLQKVKTTYIANYDNKEHSYVSDLAIIYNISPYCKLYIDAHKKGEYMADLRESGTTQLGCDTASFDITVDERSDNICTGADGYYGTYFKYPHNRACILELELDDSYVGMDRLKSVLGYVLNCKELTNKKTKTNMERE